MIPETEVTTEIERTGRPARILNAARELAIRQGFQKTSMAQVAAKARVAKGTAYSYWSSKESLFLELLARTFCDMLAEVDVAVTDDPEQGRPGKLLVAIASSVHERELLRALFNRDDEVLGVLVETEEAAELLTTHGAASLIRELVPIWRDHGAAVADASAEDQAGSLELLALGYLTAAMRKMGALVPELTAQRLEFAVDRVLGSPDPAEVTAGVRESVAEATSALLRRHLEGLRSSIAAMSAADRD